MAMVNEEALCLSIDLTIVVYLLDFPKRQL